MKPERTQLRHDQQTDHQQQSISDHSARSQQFATVEELLRHDSEQNPVPPEVAERLNHSIASEPKPEKPWYKKLFG